MDRDKWGVRHQVPVWSKECTREIEALLYVGADCGLLQRPAHGLGDAHEAVGEERQEDGIRTTLTRVKRCHGTVAVIK